VTTVDLPDDLVAQLKQEADRSHAGDVAGLIASSVTSFRRLTDPLGLLQGPLDPASTDTAQVVSQVAALSSVSVDGIARLGEAFLAAAGQVREERAGTAGDYIAPFLAWVAAAPQDRALTVSLTTTQAASGEEGLQTTGVVSVATGFLQGDGTLMSGTLSQTFSDRRSSANAPFDPGKADRLGMEIVMTSGKPPTVGITLIAESWGGGRQSLRDPEVHGGVLTALGDSVGNLAPSALYTLCLATTTIPG
jgi:hypothetical protein